MTYNLSRGAMEDIMTRDVTVDRPVFQVLGQKKIAGSAGTDRYRLLLSDGVHSHSSAMLATQLNDKIESGELATFSVICLEKYHCNTIPPDRRVMILLDISIQASGSTVGTKLGAPQPLKNTGQAQGAPAAAPAAAPAPQPFKAQPPANGQMNGPSAPSANAYGGGSSNRTPQSAFSRAPNRPLGSQNPPNTPGGTPSKVHPISSLTPYQNRWCIKARVTSKSAIRTWNNSRGEGKLFSMTLLDDSGEIRATAFTRELEKFYDMVEMNKVYYVRKATLKTANKQYSSVKNDYEMNFNQETEMIPCDDDSDMPSLSFNFIPINELEKHEANSTVDVIGIVKTVNELSTVMGKQSNKEIKKRDMQLVDENQVLVKITVWGSEAETFDGTGNPVLAAKGCRLSDWGGRSLSVLGSSQMLMNPDIPEAHRLKGWYDSVGHSLDFNEYRSEAGAGGAGSYSTNWKTFAEVKGQNIGQDKAEYFTSKGTVVYLKKENSMYMACPTADCNKKLIDQANGYYRCEKCQQEFPNYKWRMILSVNLADHTDTQWATCFQDSAEAILGKTGAELGTMKEQDEAAYDQVFSAATFKSFIFKMRAKMETYNDESRLKTVCVGISPVDYKEYNKKLIGDIEKMLSS